jgi:hypothetical protein
MRSAARAAGFPISSNSGRATLASAATPVAFYGRRSSSGRPIDVHYADFHPEGGSSGLALGHVVRVAGSFEPEKATLTLPITALYRRPRSTHR